MGIIQCGSFTGNTTVNIGWEPQWIMIKRTDAAGDWIIIDSMRGCSVGGVDAILNPNLLNAEFVSNDYIDFTATGFITKNLTGTHIYTVIRRPNKPPTTGTQVYNAVVRTGDNTRIVQLTAGFAPDLLIGQTRAGGQAVWYDRLRGAGKYLQSNSTAAEAGGASPEGMFNNTGTIVSSNGNLNGAVSYINWFFRRAPGFMDLVAYRGTGIPKTEKHNLADIPEMLWVKRRDNTGDWRVYHKDIGNDRYLVLNSNSQKSPLITTWNTTSPTSTVFSLGTDIEVNALNGQYVSYLFSTCPGISKVGSYTGNGASQLVSCGFNTGSRFVLIKRTDAAGDWYVWDSARGIHPTTDPHLSLNTTAAEVTTDDSIDQDINGFIVNQDAATNINVLGGQYIFYAIS